MPRKRKIPQQGRLRNTQVSQDPEIRRLYREAKVRTYLTEADLRYINGRPDDRTSGERDAVPEHMKRFLPPKSD